MISLTFGSKMTIESRVPLAAWVKGYFSLTAHFVSSSYLWVLNRVRILYSKSVKMMFPEAYSSKSKWKAPVSVPNYMSTTLSIPTYQIDSSLFDLRCFLSFIVNPEGMSFLFLINCVVWILMPASIRRRSLFPFAPSFRMYCLPEMS